MSPRIRTIVDPVCGPRSGKNAETVGGASYISVTALVENCCPLDATSTVTGRGLCSEPATRSRLSMRCSSYISAPVRTPMPKRQLDSGAHGLRISSYTSHSAPSFTPRPEKPNVSSTGTKPCSRTSDTSRGRPSISTAPRYTSSLAARVRSSTRRPSPAPSSPNGTSGRSPKHTLTPSPPLPPPPSTRRSKLSSK